MNYYFFFFFNFNESNKLFIFFLKIKKLIDSIIEEMIEEAKQKESPSEAQPKLPLLRLRVAYRAERQIFNAIRFGQQYTGRVRNHCEF